MGIFSTIMSKVFSQAKAAVSGASTNVSSAATGAASGSSVDVEGVLSRLASEQGKGSLNWRTSIVDLLKLLGIDSSLDARKRLAQELGYTGSTEDSGTMNMWLIRQVMQKLAENGGKVPDSLRK